MNSQMIPLFDMERHLKANRQLFDSCFKRVLDSSNLILGGEVKAFEEEFASYLDIRNCVGVANGTDALEIALRALGANTNSRIALVANAGGYARTAIDKIGAIPIYVEVEPKSLTMSIQNLKQVINTNSLDIIIITHLYGQIYPEIFELAKIAKDKNIWLIEDCAQSHGASLNGKKSGTFGVIGTFSFYPTKNLGALGDGGAIVCDDLNLDKIIRSLRQYGWKAKYFVENRFGTNSRLDELQAAFLRNLLPLLDTWNKSRKLVALSYLNAINNPRVRLPLINIENYVGHLFPIYVTEPTEFERHLNRNKVGFGNHYPVQDQLQKAWLNKDIMQEINSSEIPFTIPISQYILPSEVQKVTNVINSF